MSSAHNIRENLLKSEATLKDPGNAGTFEVTKWGGVCPIVTAAAETRTLDAPSKAGTNVVLNMATDGGDCTITVTGGYNEAGSTSIVLTDPGQFVELESMFLTASTFGWRLIAWDGATVTGPTELALTVNTVTYSGATGVNKIILTDNLASALQISEGSNKYLEFVTTDSGEQINVSKKLLFNGATATNILSLTDNLADALNIKEGTNSYLKFVTTDSSESIVLGKAATGVSLAVTGALSSSSASAGVGYATGAGGTGTQGTSKSTTTTLTPSACACGAVTTHNATLNAATIVSFDVTNTSVATTDTIVCNHISGGTLGSYTVNARAGNGKFTVDLRNNTAGNLGEALVLQFAIVKAVNA